MFCRQLLSLSFLKTSLLLRWMEIKSEIKLYSKMLFSCTSFFLCHWLLSYVRCGKKITNYQIFRRSLGHVVYIIIIIFGLQRNRVSIPGDPGAHRDSCSMGTGKAFFLPWWAESECSHSPTSNVEVKTEGSLWSTHKLDTHSEIFHKVFLQRILNPKLPRKLSIQKSEEMLDARHITFLLPVSRPVSSGAERHAVSLKCIRHRRKKSQMQITCRLQVRAQP